MRFSLVLCASSVFSVSVVNVLLVNPPQRHGEHGGGTEDLLLCVNSRRPTTARSHSQFESGDLVNVPFPFFVVIADTIRIWPILVSVHLKVAGRQKRKVDIQGSCGPVSHCTNVPLSSLPSSDDDVVSNLCIEH